MKLTNDIDALLKLAYEAEGLLLLLKSRGGEMPADALTLLTEKTAMRQAGVMDLPYDGTPVATEAAEPAPAPESDSEAIAEAAEEETIADAGEQPEVVEHESEPAVAGMTAEAETLDERLARERARDIFKAFTLNDKFRYRRELFHDSDDEFRDTLGIISGMSSFAEAEEYFYEDLCWDPENEEVRSFMEIVRKHF